MSDTKLQAALKDPNNRAVAIEMTDERRARLADISARLYDWLKANTDEPIEAMMVLRFTLDSFAEFFGVHHMQAIDRDSPEQPS